MLSFVCMRADAFETFSLQRTAKRRATSRRILYEAEGMREDDGVSYCAGRCHNYQPLRNRYGVYPPCPHHWNRVTTCFVIHPCICFAVHIIRSDRPRSASLVWAYVHIIIIRSWPPRPSASLVWFMFTGVDEFTHVRTLCTYTSVGVDEFTHVRYVHTVLDRTS